MGAYLDALDRFKKMALNLYGGPAATPDISAGYAAAMLRYLKDRQAKLVDNSCEPWEGIGEEVAKTPFATKLPENVRDRLWSYALCVCQAADREDMPFAAVKPTPQADYDLLRRRFPPPPGTTSPGPAESPATDDELEAEWGKKKDPPKKSQANVALFFIAVIVIGALAHRAR